MNRCTLALVCAASLLGCTQPHAETPVWFHRPGQVLRTSFRRLVTTVADHMGQHERGKISLDPTHNRLFVGSSDGRLYALDAQDGNTLWRFQTGGAVQCEPLYDLSSDILFFGSHDGFLYAVHAKDGTLLWRQDTGAELLRRPTLAGGILYAANASDRLLALDPHTGGVRWSVQRPSALGMEILGYAAPTVEGQRVYFAFSDGHVVAYDAATGAEVWLVDLAAEAEHSSGSKLRYFDVDTTPVLDTLGGVRAVLVSSYEGGVYALRADTGASLWNNPHVIGVTDLMLWKEPAHRSRVVPFTHPTKTLLLASSGTSGLWALDPETGNEVWRTSLPEGAVGAPVSVAGALLLGTGRYGLFLLSPRNGRVIDGVHLGPGTLHAPAGYGFRVFAMSDTGILLGMHVVPPVPVTP